jgi:hypothetical protein
MPTTLLKTTVQSIGELLRAQPNSGYVPAAKKLLEAWLKEDDLSMSEDTRQLIKDILKDIAKP